MLNPPLPGHFNPKAGLFNMRISFYSNCLFCSIAYWLKWYPHVQIKCEWGWVPHFYWHDSRTGRDYQFFARNRQIRFWELLWHEGVVTPRPILRSSGFD